jgi:DNA segregation ATPase FtsK/SpoIIIE, S-DNA-T family
MSAIDRGLDTLSFSDHLRELMRRRLRELAGLILIATALLLAAALGSWSVQDPSLSHATNAPVRNLLDVPGAVVADLLMQLFGVASVVLVLPIAVWGWRLASHRMLHRERLRILAWIAGVLLTASFAACMPRTAAWPLPAGMGGVAGDALLRLSVLLVGDSMLALIRLVIGIVTGSAAFVAVMLALGFGWREDRAAAPVEKRRAEKKLAESERSEEETEGRASRAAISLGFLVHGFLSLKARIARWLERRRARRSAPRQPPRTSHVRVEPNFGDYQTALHELEMEDEEEEESAPRARKAQFACKARGPVRPLCATVAGAAGRTEGARTGDA